MVLTRFLKFERWEISVGRKFDDFLKTVAPEQKPEGRVLVILDGDPEPECGPDTRVITLNPFEDDEDNVHAGK